MSISKGNNSVKILDAGCGWTPHLNWSIFGLHKATRWLQSQMGINKRDIFDVVGIDQQCLDNFSPRESENRIVYPRDYFAQEFQTQDEIGEMSLDFRIGKFSSVLSSPEFQDTRFDMVQWLYPNQTFKESLDMAINARDHKNHRLFPPSFGELFGRHILQEQLQDRNDLLMARTNPNPKRADTHANTCVIDEISFLLDYIRSNLKVGGNLVLNTEDPRILDSLRNFAPEFWETMERVPNKYLEYGSQFLRLDVDFIPSRHSHVFTKRD